MQGQSGQAADQSSVETDVLQIPPNRELDATDQEIDVPGLDLIGDETADTALLALHEVAEDAGCAVNRWQREQMRRWRDGVVTASPLYWAALVTFTVDGIR